MTEVYLLSRDKVKWHWYENPDSLDPGGMWDNRVDQAEDDPELRTFYLAQLVVSCCNLIIVHHDVEVC